MIKYKVFLFFVLGFFTIMSVGCALYKYEHGNILSSYYKSVITKEETKDPKIPVSLRITQIDFTLPSVGMPIGGFILKFFPLLSLIPIPDEIRTNVRHADTFLLTKRAQGEIERVITAELKKTMLFNEVVFEGDQKDFDIQGRVNFKIDIYSHFCGVGFIFSMPLILVCPIANFYYICEAHFDVVKTENNETLFSKDYYSKSLLVMGTFNEGNDDQIRKSIFGEKVFPPIVKEFINDLKINLKQNFNTAQLNEN